MNIAAGSTAAVTLPDRTPVASYKHTLGLFAIALAVGLAGLSAQSRPTAGNSLASSHAGALSTYFVMLGMEAALLYFVWVGVHKKGVNLWSLSGRGWFTIRDALRDITVALPFWVFWQVAAIGAWALIGPSNAKTVDSLLPISWMEVSVWILLSATAGIVEELVFRGYLQRQLTALSGKLSLAVIGQALVFGLMHAYQGWKAAAVISFLGLLYGVLAAWRGTLRPGMLAHAMSDVWEGWLKFVVGSPY